MGGREENRCRRGGRGGGLGRYHKNCEIAGSLNKKG